MGKSGFAQAIGLNASKRGYPVAFVSAEMPASQIGVRIISSETGIENRDLRRGRIQDREFGRIVEATSRVNPLPLWLLDSDRSWPRLLAKIRALKLKHPKLALVIVDYIGLLQTPGDRERYLELGQISSEAKELAMALDIGVILCSQLNRAVESRNDKRTQLSDLRESGNLEQDSDLVMLLFRPSYYDADFKPRELVYLDVAKNRNGATGVLKLHFDERTVSFTDWTDPAPARDVTEPKAAVG
jgi:replicative DNA helicase